MCNVVVVSFRADLRKIKKAQSLQLVEIAMFLSNTVFRAYYGLSKYFGRQVGFLAFVSVSRSMLKSRIDPSIK